MKNLNLIVERTPKNASNFAVVSFREDMALIWFQGNTIEECEHWINLQREDSEAWFNEDGTDSEITTVTYQVVGTIRFY